MAMKGLTELNIFRGTYREVMAKDTMDMTIYLAWDTQEIFIGNKNGVKVKYGGSRQLETELNKYFNDFRKDIYDSVTNHGQSIIADKLAEFREEYQTAIDNLRGEITRTCLTYIDNTLYDKLATVNASIGKLEGNISDIDDVCKEISKRVAENNNAISELLNLINVNKDDISANTIEITNLKDRLLAADRNILSNATNINKNTDSISKLNSDVAYLNITTATNKENISKVNERANENYQAIQNISTSVNSLNNILTTVSESVSKNTENIESHSTKISNISKEIEELKNAETPDVEITTAVLFETGNLINTKVSELESLNTLKDFLPTLCILNSDDKKYKAGAIYYYDLEKGKIVATTSGVAANKKNMDVGLYLSIRGNSKFQVTKEDILVKLRAEVTSGKLGLVDSLKVIAPDGGEYKIDDSMLSIDFSYNISGIDVGKKQFRLTGNLSITEDDEFIYSLTDSLASVSVYQPTLIGNLSSLKLFDDEQTEFEFDITPNEVFYIYTTKEISDITSSGFSVPFISNGLKAVPTDVNGVSGLMYYEYITTEAIDDSSIKINIIYKK